jgi:hypothetical protein
MLQKVFQLLGVSCAHRRLSHPFAAAAITRNKSEDWDSVTESGGHYVVCLDCGHKFQYDWSNMRVIWH